MKKRRILTTFIITIIVFSFIAGAYWYLKLSPTPFNPAIWLSGERVGYADKAPRLRMADGLINSGILLGKNRDEVLKMLGAPIETSKFCDYDFVYWLGPERNFMSMDSEWLVIRTNSLENVAEARIVRD